MDKIRIKSPTGCVHVADSLDRSFSGKMRIYITMCNHASGSYPNGYINGYWHEWPQTKDPVTCKRCIKILKGNTHKTVQIPMEDYEILKKIGKKLRERLHDPRQGGASDLTRDGKEWRFSFPPRGLMSPAVKEVQALIRFAGLEELKPVEYGEECKTCVHGQIGDHTPMLWPVIDDCKGCLSPQHQHHLPLKDIHKYNSITRGQVYEIPTGSSIHWAAVRAAKKGYKYYEAGGFVYHISNELAARANDIGNKDEDLVWKMLKKCKRICLLTSLNKLFVAADKR